MQWRRGKKGGDSEILVCLKMFFLMMENFRPIIQNLGLNGPILGDIFLAKVKFSSPISPVGN